jgi:hypothetical protein
MTCNIKIAIFIAVIEGNCKSSSTLNFKQLEISFTLDGGRKKEE